MRLGAVADNKAMRRSSSLALAVGLLAAGLLSQQPEPASRDGQEAEKQVTSHVRLDVRLRNGNKLTGVVKSGRFVERAEGLRFVAAAAAEQGAGVRIWYLGGARNFVFVPFAEVVAYEVRERLTQQQLDELEAKLRQAEPARAPSTPPIPAAPGGAAKPPGLPDFTPPRPKPPTAEVASETARKEVSQERRELLVQFPPTAGWNKQKRDEIARRLAVVGAVPSAKEKAFVEQFAAWEAACRELGVGAEPAAEPAVEPKESRPTRRVR